MSLQGQSQPLGWDQSRELLERSAELKAAEDLVATVDFSMLKRKLIEEHDWTPEYVAEVEDLYRDFLVLNMLYPDQKICPTGPIDDFWHAHILDTRAYAADCEVLFGRMLHHFPYFGMRGPDDRRDLEVAFERSRVLFVRHFGVDPCVGEAEARGCSPQNCP